MSPTIDYISILYSQFKFETTLFVAQTPEVWLVLWHFSSFYTLKKKRTMY